MTTKCPHCNKKLKLVDTPVFLNIQTYGGTATVLTECCDNFVRVSGQATWKWYFTKCAGEKFGKCPPEDSWGNPQKGVTQ